MKFPRVSLCLILSTSAFSQDFRPESHFETIPAADSSVQECYVFRTKAGLRYTVESSHDLTNWTAQEEIYGLGHEYVVTMRQYTPPPPSSRNAPAPPVHFTPVRNASIRMERAAGADGGTVVSWASLDQGGPVVVRIAGDMATEWFQIPIYSERFGNHNFFVWHPPFVVNPPSVNSILGAKDSAMLALLEASLPTMNDQVIASVARIRNAPAPVPVSIDPDSKRFWRILVDSSIDTDSDGTPDWSEFVISANAVAGLPVHMVGDFQNGSAPGGNAFDSDTNGDGIPDGEQLDTDGDSIADAFDIASSDATATYEIGPLPRYALFEIPGNALQINDLGTVIYAYKTWKGGIVAPLPSGPAGESASARGINDLDVIIGTEGRDPARPMMPESLFGKICFWPSPSQAYQYIQVVEAGKTVFAYRHHDGFGNQGPASILSSSGHFIAHGNDFNDELGLEIGDLFDYAPTLWQVPTGGVGANRQAAPRTARYVGTPSLMWGRVFPSANLQGTVFAPSPLPNLPFAPLNVISQPSPNGHLALFATPPADFTQTTGVPTTKAYLDGKWQESPTFAMAIDISADGTAIGRNHGSLKAPVLLNGQWTDIKRYAPGAPAEWADINTRLLDTTPGGWILANRSNGTAAGVSGVLLPLMIEGTPPEPNIAKEATGVDAFSIGCENPGPTVQDRIGIMAPSDGGVTEFILKAPLNDNTPLKLSAPGIRFNGDDEKILTAKENLVTLESSSTEPTGTEIPLRLHLGEGESVNQPLGVKVMKGRTVRVSMHNVTKQIAGETDNTADLAPNSSALQAYLNAVFGPQLNTAFIVTQRETLSLDWDSNSNNSMEGSIGNPSTEQQLILDKRPKPIPDSDVNVFFLGTAKKIHNDTAWGATNRVANSCWVVGDTLANPSVPGSGRTYDEVLQTVAHEIGHVLVDYGHPDDGGGHAPLPRTDHRERLMHSGSGLGGPIIIGIRLQQARGHRLVKQEWDEAEQWLKTRPNGDH
jgi:hypothetical protein